MIQNIPTLPEDPEVSIIVTRIGRAGEPYTAQEGDPRGQHQQKKHSDIKRRSGSSRTRFWFHLHYGID
jgi:hypothetical protein